jgi:hypothetical protein
MTGHVVQQRKQHFSVTEFVFTDNQDTFASPFRTQVLQNLLQSRRVNNDLSQSILTTSSPHLRKVTDDFQVMMQRTNKWISTGRGTEPPVEPCTNGYTLNDLV